MKKFLIVVIPGAVGLLLPFVPPFILPGYLFGVLFFPEGVHSDHAMAWLIVVTLFNLVLYGGLTFAILRRVWRD